MKKFWKDLGNVAKNAAKRGAGTKISDSVYAVLHNQSMGSYSVEVDSMYNETTGSFGVTQEDTSSVNIEVNDIGGHSKAIQSSDVTTLDTEISRSKALTENTATAMVMVNNQGVSLKNDINEWRLHVRVPYWGYADLITERALWQKGLSSQLGERGWFYFKIFFEFDTQFGLLGGVINNSEPDSTKYLSASNTAAKYLASLGKNYTYIHPKERLAALEKFVGTLSYINCNAPWFFKSIKNLNEAGKVQLNEFSKEKSIEIAVSEDAIDMRLTTLLDLYKFACFDDINNKEIIPSNLRKFDMTVVVFEAPLRYFHTAIRHNNNTYDYKTLTPKNNDWSNVMSYKMFSFKNCEIHKDSLGSMIPGDISNNQPFNLGNTSIKIKYDRVYQHTMNEFDRIMFGSTGVYYNEFSACNSLVYNKTTNDIQGKRYDAMVQQLANAVIKKSNNPASFKKMVDASEAICNYNLISVGGFTLGNLYGEDLLDGDDYWTFGDHDVQIPGKQYYFKAKNQYLKNHKQPWFALTKTTKAMFYWLGVQWKKNLWTWYDIDTASVDYTDKDYQQYLKDLRDNGFTSNIVESNNDTLTSKHQIGSSYYNAILKNMKGTAKKIKYTSTTA